MAPLRSSRHTRHHDSNTTTRAGRATTDFDPTDGLPVRRFILESISINQDASVEATDPANAQLPWPEQPLPTFFDQLPPHNQELLRRARAGERETKASIWDRKAHEWVRYDEARKRGLTGESGMRKSRYLINISNEDGEENAAENDDDDGSDENSDDDNNDGDENTGANGDANGAAAVVPSKSKKRKQPPTQLLQDRTFDVKKWTQIPFDKADKMPEPKYLADRRPGMSNYYNQSAAGAWAHAQGYGLGLEGGAGGGPAYDLGDGAGLGSAMGGQQQPGSETPVRKNMPPRPRKKKGGPGRKKKEVVEAEKKAAEEARRKAEVEARGAVAEVGEAEGGDKTDAVPRLADEGEIGVETPRSKKDGGEGSGDDSEADGSEEGEVNEGNESGSATPSASGAAAGGVPSAPASVVGLGLNAPTIPSSLSREVDMGAAEDAAEAVSSAVAAATDVAAVAPPAQLDTQMIDAPAASTAEADATNPPPVAQATVPTPLITDSAAIVTPTRPQPPSPTLDPSPITPPPGDIDESVGLGVPSSTEAAAVPDSRASAEISVPFDPRAAKETAPLLRGVEMPTAEQIDAGAAEVGGSGEGQGDTSTQVREERTIREAAIQGEAKEFAAVEATGAVAQEEGLEAATEAKKETEQRQEEEDGAGEALDLLGGLERDLDKQHG